MAHCPVGLTVSRSIAIFKMGTFLFRDKLARPRGRLPGRALFPREVPVISPLGLWGALFFSRSDGRVFFRRADARKNWRA